MSRPVYSVLSYPDPAAYYYRARIKQLSAVDEVKALSGQYPALADAIAHFAADAFFAHYALRTELVDQPPDHLRVQHGVMSEYMSTPEYRAAHRIAMYHAPTSQYFAIRLTKHVVELLRQQLNEEELQQLEQQFQHAQQQQCPNCGGVGCSQCQLQQSTQQSTQTSQQHASHQQSQHAGQQSTASRQSQSPSLTAVGDALKRERLAQKLRGVLREAVHRATKDAEQAHEVLRSSWGTEAGELIAGELAELPRVAVEELADIVRLGNRIAHIYMASKQEYSPWGEYSGYRSTRNVEEALPSELALPDELFWSKYTQNGLLAVDRRVRKERDITLVIDFSGSMNDAVAGRPKHVWAKAIAHAAYTVARRRGVKVGIVLFNFDVMLRRDNVQPSDMFELARMMPAGGTDIMGALMAAERRGRHVILITDGEAPVDGGRIVSDYTRNNAVLSVAMLHREAAGLQDLRNAVKTLRGGWLELPALNEASAAKVLRLTFRNI